MTEKKKDLPSPSLNNGSTIPKQVPSKPSPPAKAEKNNPSNDALEKSSGLSPSRARQAAAQSLAQAPKQAAGWKLSAKFLLDRWMKFVLLPVIVWVILSYVGVVPIGLRDAITMGMAILLFIVGMPISIFFRLDALLRDYVEYLGHTGCLIVLLLVSGLNIGLIGAIRGWLSPGKTSK